MLPKNRLEIQFIRHVEIRTHGLRVAVHHDGLKAGFSGGQQTVYTGIIEFNPLPNSVRAGSQYDNLGPIA